MTTAEIRQSFTGYFVRNNHKLLASSPVIPFDDPTILFTNAGMNQFKDVFTGRRKPEFPRATTVQKCLRAGGKHNDLDNVGFTARHHTFFEMLGNFSFGDYFKEEAIKFAWEWVTKELKLPTDRLYASVYESDDDAFDLWGKIAPELKNGRILRFGKKDNFWSMGDVGPCGPCSEIHFDRGEKYGVGPEHTVNGETDRFVEIWNLVFMQFNQPGDGTMAPLPKPSVDTGAGLERITAIMQKVDSNYQIDLFAHIVKAISEITHAKYADNVTSQNVIADHVRALTFCLADGAGISNEGRGYVLRRILRRAARHGRLLGMHEPFIFKVVPALVEQMGSAYPEIKEKQAHVQNVIKAEEESFLRTLDTGCDLFDRVAAKVKASGSTVVPGDEVFKLYDTYGFPYDLTEIIAAESNLVLDQIGFEKAMKEQQERSRASSGFNTDTRWLDIIKRIQQSELHPTRFRRDELRTSVTMQHAFADASKQVQVILDETPFYTESGGQVSDVGRIYDPSFSMSVLEMKVADGVHVHIGILERGTLQDLSTPRLVTAEVDISRRWDIMRNHTVTHLTQAALRKVLGDQVKQSGSYVGPDYMRFDFSHHQPMTAEEIREVEQIVNSEIIKGHEVRTEKDVPIAKAKAMGAMALFGEKYGETVRVVEIRDKSDGRIVSMELCGGTHVENTGQIGSFVIVAESGIASGVRRIECITGRKATEYLLSLKQFRQQVSQTVNRPESEALVGVKQLKETNADLQKELKKAISERYSGGVVKAEDEVTVGKIKFQWMRFSADQLEQAKAWSDEAIRANNSIALVTCATVAPEAPNASIKIVTRATAAAIDHEGFDASIVAKTLFPKFGGRGGGKPGFVQGSISGDVREFWKALTQSAKDLSDS